MKTLALAACAALTAGTHAEIPKYSPELFYDTTTIFGSSFSHDETKILITTDDSGVFNVYAQPVAGGEPTRLTFSEESPRFGISFFPNDDRFLYTADEGGNELNHVFVQTLDGEATDLTPGENLKASFAGWAGDLRHFYIATNERDPKFFDLYKYSASDYSRDLIFENTDGFSPGSISRDGHWLSLIKNNNNADSDVFLVDLGLDLRLVE